MELSTWAHRNQITLDNLQVHLLHWEEFLLTQEPLLVRHAKTQPLQASLSRHSDLSQRSLMLLQQQRALLAQLEVYLARRDPNGLPPRL